jgi:hypothetical protein
VIAYYLTQRAEVDAYLRQSEEAAIRLQREAEAGYSPDTRALHARLRGLRAK